MNFLESVIDFFHVFISIIVNFVNSILQIITLANTAVSLPPLLQGVMPTVVGGCIFAVVACSVIKFILGR